jgi:hypothetical protein
VATRTEPIFVEYRRRPGRRKAVLAGAGVILLLLAAVYAVRSTVASPESTVAAYFAALADRDAGAALRVTAPEVAGQVDRTVINEAVLGSPDYTPPGQVSVSGVTVDGRDAVAEVSFAIEGRPYQVALRLRRDEGVVDAVLHRWLVIDGVGSLLLGEVPGQITVNGQPVAAYDAVGPRILPALPGGYRIGVPDGDPLWEPRTTPAQVAPQRATEVDAALVARPAVEDEVDRQMVRLLDMCAASTELVPPGCPFGYPVAGSAEDVAWRIVRYPAIGLAAGSDPGDQTAVVRTTREGEAVVTGTRRFVGRFVDMVPIPVAGTVRVSGGTVVFQPGW